MSLGQYVPNAVDNAGRFAAMCRAYKDDKTLVCMVTERMVGNFTFDQSINLGRVTVVQLYSQEHAAVYVCMDGYSWTNNRFTPAAVGHAILAFDDSDRSRHTTFYDTTPVIKAFLRDVGTFMPDRVYEPLRL